MKVFYDPALDQAQLSHKFPDALGFDDHLFWIGGSRIWILFEGRRLIFRIIFLSPQLTLGWHTLFPFISPEMVLAGVIGNPTNPCIRCCIRIGTDPGPAGEGGSLEPNLDQDLQPDIFDFFERCVSSTTPDDACDSWQGQLDERDEGLLIVSCNFTSSEITLCLVPP